MQDLPTPPYYAVIFVSRLADADSEGYAAAARRMVELAQGRTGFLGMDSVRGDDGLGMTVSYWRSEADIAAWRDDAEHRIAQRHGKERWYRDFTLRVARVERQTAWP